MKISLTLAIILGICFAEVYSKRVVKVASRNGGYGQQKIEQKNDEEEEKVEEKEDKDGDESVLKGQYEQKQEETINKNTYEEKEDKVDVGVGGGYEQQKEVKVNVGGGGYGGQQKEVKVNIGGGGYGGQQKEVNIGGGGYGQGKETYITGGSHVVHKQVGGGYGGGGYGGGHGGYGGGHGGYGGGHVGYKKQCGGGPCKYDGELVPDPDSCCKYYKCAHCKPVPMKCGPGTHYNPYLKVCDFPGKAGCVARDQKCGYYHGKW